TNLITSYTNPIYASLNIAWTYTNTAYSASNVAYNAANTALSNTSGVSFNGNFNVPTGNVGIGTTSPTSKFQVVGANAEITRITATGASGGYQAFYFDNSTPWYIGSSKATSAGNINDLYIGSGFGTTNNLIFGSSGTEQMRITSTNGNIGIGTSTPTTLNGNVSKLINVLSPVNSVINFTSNTAGFAGVLEFNRTGRSGVTRYAQFQGQTDASDNGLFIFYTAVAGADVTEQARIDTTGITGKFPSLFQSSTQATTSTDRSLGVSASWTDHLSVTFTTTKVGPIYAGAVFAMTYESGFVQGEAQFVLSGAASKTSQYMAVAQQSDQNRARGAHNTTWMFGNCPAGTYTLTLQVRNNGSGSTWILNYYSAFDTLYTSYM
ncbi:hypothetical protein EB001_25260, partial [bacterium]|nr:hypothetical protein [bacterium]